MSRRLTSKRARFAHHAKVRRRVARVRRENSGKPGFLGVAHSMSIGGMRLGMGALFITSKP